MKGKQSIGVLCLVLFLAILVFGVFSPTKWYFPSSEVVIPLSGFGETSFYGEVENSTSRTNYNVTMTFVANYTFTANWSPSVENPINVTVVISPQQFTNGSTSGTNVNVLDFFRGVYFSNSQFADNSSIAPIRLDPYSITKYFKNASGQVIGSQTTTGLYRATANLKFTEAGTTYFDLIPVLYEGGSLAVQAQFINQDNPTIAIQPVSDTLNVEFNQNIVRLTIIVGSFSPLLLQPVLEAIFVKRNRKTDADVQQQDRITDP